MRAESSIAGIGMVSVSAECCVPRVSMPRPIPSAIARMHITCSCFCHTQQTNGAMMTLQNVDVVHPNCGRISKATRKGLHIAHLFGAFKIGLRCFGAHAQSHRTRGPQQPSHLFHSQVLAKTQSRMTHNLQASNESVHRTVTQQREDIERHAQRGYLLQAVQIAFARRWRGVRIGFCIRAEHRERLYRTDK